MKYSILMCCHNNIDLTMRAINSLLMKAGTPDFELLICDDGSTDDTKKKLEVLNQHYHITVIKNTENIGVPKSMNKLISISRGKYLLRVDNDIEMVTPSYLESMSGWFEFFNKQKTKPLGACSCITNNTSGHAGNRDKKDVTNNFILYSQINGYCQMLLKKAVFEVGMIDESFPKVYGEDRDMIYRIIQKGYNTGICENVFCYHQGKKTFPPNTMLGGLYWIKSNSLMKEKWCDKHEIKTR